MFLFSSELSVLPGSSLGLWQLHLGYARVEEWGAEVVIHMPWVPGRSFEATEGVWSEFHKTAVGLVK